MLNKIEARILFNAIENIHDKAESSLEQLAVVDHLLNLDDRASERDLIAEKLRDLLDCLEDMLPGLEMQKNGEI